MKILIISHNPLTMQNNMAATLRTLLSGISREELCQLYIYPTLPNADRCCSQYRITDKEILRKLFTGKKAGSEIDPRRISPDEGRYEDPADEAVYRDRRNKSPLRRLLRDDMWTLARWYDRGLKAWLEREKPDRIFVAPGAARFIYDFALRISGDLDIPVVTYICDEYYFVEEASGVLERIRLHKLKRKMESLMARTEHLLVISEELKQVYEEWFGVKTSVVMTGAAVERAEEAKAVDKPRTVSYFGNIRCNRYLSLAEIGRELDEMNRDTGSGYKLKVYTFERDREILAHLENIESIELCGPVTGEEFDRTFAAAELLLHVEAFDKASVDFVRHSVSTKIADSLASGTPLLAYGPRGISSMEYLLRHGCALAATGREQLRPMLEKAFGDREVAALAAENGLKTAAQFHDREAIGGKVRGILLSVRENNC